MKKLKIAFWILIACLLLYWALSAYRALSVPYRTARPAELPKEWKTLLRIGLASLGAVLLAPIALLLRWLVVQVYAAWRTWRQDCIDLQARQVSALALARREQIVRMAPDQHGFGGVAFDQEAGTWHDLDTGESWPRQRIAAPVPERVTGRVKQGWLAAISGSTFVHRVVNEIIGNEDERPALQIADGGGEWLQIEAKAPRGEIEV